MPYRVPSGWNSCTPADAEFLDATLAAASLDAKMAKAGAMPRDASATERPMVFRCFSGSSKEKMAEKKPSENSKFKSINRCEIWWSLMNLMWWLKRIASSAKPDLKGTLRFHKCKHDTSTMIHIMSQMDLCACRSILDSWTIQTNPWTEGRKSEPGFEAGLDQNKTTKLQFQNMFRVPLVKGTDISLWFPGYGCKNDAKLNVSNHKQPEILLKVQMKQNILVLPCAAQAALEPFRAPKAGAKWPTDHRWPWCISPEFCSSKCGNPMEPVRSTRRYTLSTY